MNYKEEIEKLVHEVSIDIEENIKAEKLGGPFDSEWIRDMTIKRHIKQYLLKIIEHLKHVYNY